MQAGAVFIVAVLDPALGFFYSHSWSLKPSAGGLAASQNVCGFLCVKFAKQFYSFGFMARWLGE
jgi:hypothetical protein